MKIKTSELEGFDLDFSVAVSVNGRPVFFAAFGSRMLGRRISREVMAGNIRPSTDWSQGGPLIDKYRPVLFPAGEDGVVGFINPNPKCPYVDTSAYDERFHETYLIAAMRAIVASELGDEVDIPDELLED